MMDQNQYSQAAAQPGLAVEVISNLAIPVPPLTEQIAIDQYIHKEFNRTKDIENPLKQSIKLLNERRSALITAAVTGQIKPEEIAA